MRLAMFDTRSYDREAFEAANRGYGHDIPYLEPRLTAATAQLAAGFPAVCSFVNDQVDAAAIDVLRDGGVSLIALRSAGYNHVDLKAAAAAGLAVVRVPEYSPHAVAEHAVGLVLAVDRKIHRAYSRVREANFSLEGLVGFDLYQRTVGVIGTGRIGAVFARVMRGFGCQVLACDRVPSADLAGDAGIRYTDLDDLYRASDVISLHVPLTPQTRHLIDESAVMKMKRGVVLINTSRGALIDTRALIGGLKSGQIGAAGLDVYEEEAGIFFSDLSNEVLQDDVLARLLTFPNVLVTSHQAFLTREALATIAETTLESVGACERGEALAHEVRADDVLR